MSFRFVHCLICDDQASGIHFGVLTCEACKAFYRRMSTGLSTMPLPCSPNRCEINLHNRNNCPSCRFDKCKRLGMDRENVIYGKPSKQQQIPLQKFNELITNFQRIHSLEHRTDIDEFAHRVFEIFYEQHSSLSHHSSDIMFHIFNLVFHSNVHLRMSHLIWLFVYYYETFLFKQSIDSNRLIILIKYLDMELNRHPDYYGNECHWFKIDFLNTFTRLTNRLDEISLENNEIISIFIPSSTSN